MKNQKQSSNNVFDVRERLKSKTKRTSLLVLTAMLFAIAIVLSLVEGALPALIPSVPGVRFGLSNIAVMYSLFFLRKREAFAIAFLKSMFVLSTRGLIAGLLSLSGGVFSLFVMIVLMGIFRERISYLMLSIAGAIFHNLGQLAAVAVVYTSLYTFVYFPVLLISGVIAGTVTATLLRVAIPALKRLGR